MIEFLIWFIASFISTFGVSFLYINLNKLTKHINFKIIFLLLLGSFCLALTKYYDLLILSSISYFLFYPYLFYSLNKLSLKKLFFYVIVIWLYGMFFDFLSMVMLSILNYILNFNIHSTVYIVLPSILMSIILILISKSKKLKSITIFLFKYYEKIEYLDYLLLIFIFYIFFLGIVLAINIQNITIDLLIISIIILSILFVSLFIKNRLDGFENQIFLNTLKENNNFYISMNVENHIFKHNLVAKMLSIKSVSNKKARCLIDEMLMSFGKNVDFSTHIQTIPYGINGIIYQKLYSYLERINLKIYNQIEFDIFQALKPKRYNVFVEKMVLMLDNAIESCLNSFDKLLVINLYRCDDLIIVEIKNTFSDNLNIDDLGTKNYSTKGQKRGFGLFSALRDKEATINVKIINNFFVAKIVAEIDKNYK